MAQAMDISVREVHRRVRRRFGCAPRVWLARERCRRVMGRAPGWFKKWVLSDSGYSAALRAVAGMGWNAPHVHRLLAKVAKTGMFRWAQTGMFRFLHGFADEGGRSRAGPSGG